jgi:hypothetical protein
MGKRATPTWPCSEATHGASDRRVTCSSTTRDDPSPAASLSRGTGMVKERSKLFPAHDVGVPAVTAWLSLEIVREEVVADRVLLAGKCINVGAPHTDPRERAYEGTTHASLPADRRWATSRAPRGPVATWDRPRCRGGKRRAPPRESRSATLPWRSSVGLGSFGRDVMIRASTTETSAGREAQLQRHARRPSWGRA